MKLTPENFKFGSDKVCLPDFTKGEYFTPHFVTSDSICHGVNDRGYYDYWNTSYDNWQLWTPPTPEKKFEKRVMYTPMYKDSQYTYSAAYCFDTIAKAEYWAKTNGYELVGYIEHNVTVEIKE